MSTLPWTIEDLDKNPENDPVGYEKMLDRIEETCGRDLKARHTELSLFLAERGARRIRTGGPRYVLLNDPVLIRTLDLSRRIG